ncbi:DUF1800 domain-containing protein [Parasulfitobacter algicola]|uniref:DUF1800 domain-containing protein n=1 Tax=Parasulfitobacter algicola TaxID=2614809 RepID=A0ABX2IXY1_9RHOB|nr:DUF1800 domain-containing protein [Sulfitobacter algicola]NSX56110.1 DUF1800 domain-containing protein [Sulfitobacter algicola]
MDFDPVFATIRFGTGLAPGHDLPLNADMTLDTVTGPDVMSDHFPIARFEDQRPLLVELRASQKIERTESGTEVGRRARDRVVELRKQVWRQRLDWLRASLARGIGADHGFRERLTWFWGDHFTAEGKNGVTRHMASSYAQGAIRPHVGGYFADMLKAAVTNPFMLQYLDQIQSAGPNSRAAVEKNRGLNENLAREVLELHTLGVNGPYGQADVYDLARILAGLTYSHNDGFRFREFLQEPGEKTVLGKRYGNPSLQDVHAVLDDLAAHPMTARHIARKLAVHFVSDTADAELIDHMSAQYLASDGYLPDVYQAMLIHPAAWATDKPNVKMPFEYIVSALRALGVTSDQIMQAKRKDVRRFVDVPLQVMGQPWEQPGGPDGWPEQDSAWITPQGLAGRIQWAMMVPQLILSDLPDPRDFVLTALGKTAPEQVKFAAASAESQWEGVGVVLASAAFQTR